VAAREFEVGEPRIGLAISAYTLAMAGSSVPAGLLGDRFGQGKVLLAFFWMLAAAAVGCALAPTYGALLVAHALLGLAAGLFHPAGLSLVSLSVEPAQLGRAMGTFGLIGGVGWFLVPSLMNTGLGWRTGFAVIAGAGVLGAIVTHVMLARGLVMDGPAAEEQTSSSVKKPGLEGRRTKLLLVSVLAAMGINAFMLDGFLPMFPETVNSIGSWIVQEHTLISCVLAVGAIGQYMGGILARDHFAASRYAVLLLLQPLTLLSLAYSLEEPAWPFMLMGSFAFMNFMTQPIENKLLAVYTSSRRRATAFALKFVVALVVAAPAGWLVATLYGGMGWSFQQVYRLLALVGILGVFAGYLFLRQARLAAEAAVRERARERLHRERRG
jgi:FSR family fosmidomycin resistance protein-like MFS transporter